MLEAYSYITMLYCKNAELDALRNLDTAIKAVLFPILGIGPGQFNELSSTIAKDKEAAAGLRVALTLDENKLGKSKKYPAKEQFDALFDTSNGFEKFYQLVSDWEAAIPVLCTLDGIYENVFEQVEQARALDRGAIVRVRKHEYSHFIEVLKEGAFNGLDCSFAIDGERTEDLLQQEAWMSDAISQVTLVHEHAEIICLSSSFPKDFSHVKGKGVFSNDDRDLFDRLKRRHNDAVLKYGDWGSTRPADASISSTPRPRIDVPTEREWISFRQSDNDESGYIGQAKHASEDSVWKTVPNCWGKRVVELTALRRPNQIRGTQMANSARINMHLTVQAMAGTMDTIPEEPFTDSF